MRVSFNVQTGVLQCLLLALYLLSGSSYADVGVDWLSGQSNVDGSYGSDASVSTSYQSTVETLRMFHALNISDNAGVPAALQFINDETFHNTEYLSRKIITNIAYGLEVSALVDELKSRQNSDGGFGDFPGHDSSALNTAFAAEAFAATGQTSIPEAVLAVTYLLNIQSSNGSWALPFNNPSVYVTSHASIALQKYVFSLDVSSAIDAASQYLIDNQNLEGNWDSDWESAYAIIALAPVFSDTGQLFQAVDTLRNNQLANGSWGEDAFISAVSLRALRAVDNVQVPTQPTSFLGGTVIDASGEFPLSNTTIYISDGINQVSTTSGSDGRFKLFNIQSVSYDITYSRPGYISTTTTLPFIAQPGEFINVGTIRLSRDENVGLISGVITSASTGEPLPYVSVQLVRNDDILPRSKFVYIESGGSYSFSVEAPGDITMYVTRFGYQRVVSTISVTNDVINFSPALYLDGEQTDSDVSITGKIMDFETDEPIGNASIEIASQSLVVTTDATGSFEMTGVAPGKLDVKISSINYVDRSFLVAGENGTKLNLGNIFLIPINSGQPPRKTIVSGTVTHSLCTCIPIQGATVIVEGTALAAVTDAAGYYEIRDIESLNFSVFTQADSFISEFRKIDLVSAERLTIDISMDPIGKGGIAIVSASTDQASYNAYSYVNFDSLLENQGSDAITIRAAAKIVNSESNIIDSFTIGETGQTSPDDEFIPMLPRARKSLSGKWYTGSSAPGSYKIVIQTFDVLNNQILSEKVIGFIINETSNIEAINVIAEPRFTNIDATEQVTLTAYIDNKSNISHGITISYTFIDPIGNIIREAQETYQVVAEDMRKKVNIDTFAHTFTSSGEHVFKVQAIGDISLPEVGRNSIVVAPSTRVDVNQGITPQLLSPDNDQRVRIKIRIEGVSK